MFMTENKQVGYIYYTVQPMLTVASVTPTHSVFIFLMALRDITTSFRAFLKTLEQSQYSVTTCMQLPPTVLY